MICEKDRQTVLTLIEETSAAGIAKAACCALFNISYRTVQRWKKQGGTKDLRLNAQRSSPANKLSEEEQANVLNIANSPPYHDLSPSKIVPLLADEGRYIASESTFYRILKQAQQLGHRHRSKPKQHRKPVACIAYKSNQVWSWDITYLPTMIQGQYVYLYMIMDIFSRKIVGWAIHENESSSYASALMTQSCLDEHIQPHQLVLHSDNGAPMKGLTMRATLEKLGVVASFSRPSVSDDNPYSESLFKTLKYHPTFPRFKRFENINQARMWAEQFVNWYNTQHLHSALKFVTPLQKHNEEDHAILAKRHKVYQLARKKKPERWTQQTRNWHPIQCVTLNPNHAHTKDPTIANHSILLRKSA